MAVARGAHSETGAMRDVYQQAETDLQPYLEAFPCHPEQKGSLVFLKGKPIALDLLSRASAYEQLHSKLVKSYALEAMLPSKATRAKASADEGARFCNAIRVCPLQQFPAVASGEEWRFSGQVIVGSALVFEQSVIHAAFFSAAEQGEDIPSFASYRRRREFRADGHEQP